jgi:hypothetical protein
MIHLAKNLPADVERYVEEGLEDGMPESKAWAVAWSRYCEYKNPSSSHCKKDEYFQGRKGTEFPSPEILGKTLNGCSTKRASAGRVAQRYLGASILKPRVKKAINADLIRMGLDGNTRYKELKDAFLDAQVVLESRGLEILDPVLPARTPSGRAMLSIALSNPEDSATPINTSVLTLHWTTLEGGLEVIAYLS